MQKKLLWPSKNLRKLQKNTLRQSQNKLSDAESQKGQSPAEIAAVEQALAEAISKPPKKIKKVEAEEGARVNAKYHHRDEDYILVTHDDLREIKGMGVLQQALFGSGTFLFSGAFWLLIDLFTQQTLNNFSFTPWMGMCVVSMVAGSVLAFVGWKLFQMREARLDKYPVSKKISEVLDKN